MKTFETCSPEETETLAAQIAAEIRPGTILLLRGDLGAGKTAFARGFARGLGITDPVSSPTFTIVQEYVCPDGRMLYHMDLYRINDSDAALAFNPEMKIFVEAKAYASYTSSDSPWYVLSQDGNDMIARLEMQEITKVYGLKDVYELAEQLPDTFTADYKTSDGIQYYGISIPKSAVSTSPGESFITTNVTPEGQPRSMKIR